MTAVSPAGRLSPYSQVQQFCSSLWSLANSVCESTDTAFRRVHVMKRGADGNIKLYDVKVDGETRRVGVLSYIEDIKTGNMYLDEPGYIVSFKCALIALGMPLYTTGKMAWHLFKTPIEITAIAIDTIVRVGQLLVRQRLQEGATEMRRGLFQIADTFGTGLFEIIKAPLFGLGMELAALYGIFKPHHGRKFEAMVESAWQKGASYKDDFRNIPPRENETCWEAFMKDIKEARPFYLAHCFQVRGNTAEPRVIVIRRDAL